MKVLNLTFYLFKLDNSKIIFIKYNDKDYVTADVKLYAHLKFPYFIISDFCITNQSHNKSLNFESLKEMDPNYLEINSDCEIFENIERGHINIYPLSDEFKSLVNYE
jgi:hypothetical protein